jgi:hypothetical protein
MPVASGKLAINQITTIALMLQGENFVLLRQCAMAQS